MLNFNDDADPHQKTDARDWRESYYCNFFDKESDLCGLFWQGVRPNSKNGEAVFLLFDGSTDLVRSVDMTVSWLNDMPEQRRIVGPQTFTCIAPWNRWAVEYKRGTDILRVDWRRLSEVCDWDWGDLASGARHFQAAGHVEVEGVIGGRKLRFAGYGERDRAWGERNYGPIKVCFFFTVQFPDDVAVHSFVQLDPASGEYRLTGYLHRDGITCGLSSFDAEFSYSDVNSLPERGRVTFADTRGREIVVDSFECMNYLGMGTEPNGAELREGNYSSGSLAFLSFQRFHRNDGVRGRGMIDYNCWAGQRPPVVKAAAPPLYSKLYEFER
jgi:hypothetical protein